jgi:hypothetical protein
MGENGEGPRTDRSVATSSIHIRTNDSRAVCFDRCPKPQRAWSARSVKNLLATRRGVLERTPPGCHPLNQLKTVRQPSYIGGGARRGRVGAQIAAHCVSPKPVVLIVPDTGSRTASCCTRSKPEKLNGAAPKQDDAQFIGANYEGTSSC